MRFFSPLLIFFRAQHRVQNKNEVPLPFQGHSGYRSREIETSSIIERSTLVRANKKKIVFFVHLIFCFKRKKKIHIFFVDHVVTIEASFQTVFGQLTFDRK